MFKVKGRFEQTEQTITVYAVKNEGDLTFFLIYYRGYGQWEWENANRFIPVEQ